MSQDIPLGNLVVRMMGDSRHFDAMIGRVEGRMIQAGQVIGRIGRNLTFLTTVPLTAFGAYALKAFGGFNEEFGKVYSLIEDFAAGIGSRFKPAIDYMVQKVQEASDWWRDLGDETQKNYIMIGLIAAAIP